MVSKRVRELVKTESRIGSMALLREAVLMRVQEVSRCLEMI
jgi:hypothetical protein